MLTILFNHILPYSRIVADAIVKKPIQTELRTKSARKKRKSSEQHDSIIPTRKKPCLDKNPCVIFTVPAFETGRYGEDKYQERKYMGLIEGVGGGIGMCLVINSVFVSSIFITRVHTPMIVFRGRRQG